MMKLFNLLYRNPDFKARIEQLRPRLYKVAYSWCHVKELADDLVQDSMIKAMQNIKSVRNMDAFEGWMFTILANCWRDHLRRQKPTEDIDEYIFTDEHTPEHNREQQKITDIVHKAVATLPQGQRQVVTLVDLEGFSYAEVANILSIPSGTVMSRLCRARQALAQQLLELKDNGIVEKNTHIRRVK